MPETRTRMEEAVTNEAGGLKWDLHVERIGPNRAAELLAENTHNRPVSPRRVENYVREMERGEWSVIADPGIVRCVLPDGRVQLANGQHRLKAIVASGAWVQIKVTTVRCNEAEARKLYAKFDRGGTRTTADLILAALGDAGSKDVGVVSSALSIVDVLIPGGYGAMKALTTEDKADLYFANMGDAAWALALRRRKMKGGGKLSAGILAGAIACYRVAPEVATEFFESVITGELLAVGDAAYALQDLFLRGGSSKRSRTAATESEYRYWYNATLIAWRHFCHGTAVTKITVQSSTQDVATPRRRVA